MTYRDQSYYKEFQELLSRLQSGLSYLKNEKRQLAGENETLIRELREVRIQLAKANRKIDELNTELSRQPESNPVPDTLSGVVNQDNKDGDNPAAGARNQDESVPTLFDNPSNNERIVLRQQITELIYKIDRHLTESRNT